MRIYYAATQVQPLQPEAPEKIINFTPDMHAYQHEGRQKSVGHYHVKSVT